jgi:uncharacterized protein (TIGR02246 family)
VQWQARRQALPRHSATTIRVIFPLPVCGAGLAEPKLMSKGTRLCRAALIEWRIVLALIKTRREGTMQRKLIVAVARCALGAAGVWLTGLYAAAMQDDAESMIRASAAKYVEAFNRQDAAAIAALWTAEAIYSNPRTGEEVIGRAAIEAELAAMFSETKDSKLEVTVESVQFVSPHVAIEQGTARVLRPNEEPDETDYSAVHVKSGDQWLIDRMSEEPIAVVLSNYDKLKDLEWMIGTWVDEDESARIETTCSWTKNHNFINRAFTVSIGDQIEMSGIQLIGWDPAAQRIRSWIFDSDGGFGEATWKKKDNRWIINSVATLPDGSRSSSVNIMTIVDDNSFTWEATGRAVGGEILPNIDPVTVVRQEKAE